MIYFQSIFLPEFLCRFQIIFPIAYQCQSSLAFENIINRKNQHVNIVAMDLYGAFDCLMKEIWLDNTTVNNVC